MAYFVNANGVESDLLSTGDHTIGRGPLLKITDKRVSRNHAIVKVDGDGAVAICPKHTNSCYYKPSGEDKHVQLERDVWQKLSDGDQISILHYNITDLVYTVRVKTEVKTDPEEAKEKEEKVEEEEEEEKEVLAMAATDVDTVKHKPHLNVATDDTTALSTSKQSLARSPSTERSKKTRVLPTWLLGAAAATSTAKTTITDNTRPSLSKKKATPQRKASESTDASASADTKTAAVKAPPKSKVTKEKVSPPPAAVEPKPAKKKSLPSCPYGKDCYRKNPVHFQEYSHNDLEEKEEEEEEEEGDKPECPYGTSCYRKNPLHHKQYSHMKPPASDSRKRPSRASTRSKHGKKAKKSALVGDSDDDGEANSYDYTDSFIDDAEDDEGESSTSYGADSDEDADWAPMEDSEDIGELISDANDFISNDKMQK